MKEENANYKITQEMNDSHTTYYYVYKKDNSCDSGWKFVSLGSFTEAGLQECKEFIEQDKMTKPEPKLIGLYK